VNLAAFGASFMGRKLTPLNKNHLKKNIMVFISKLFNGVNVDHQNLQKLSIKLRLFVIPSPSTGTFTLPVISNEARNLFVGRNALLRTGSAGNL